MYFTQCNFYSWITDLGYAQLNVTITSENDSSALIHYKSLQKFIFTLKK